jgi:hypothetical protein
MHRPDRSPATGNGTGASSVAKRSILADRTTGATTSELVAELHRSITQLRAQADELSRQVVTSQEGQRSD